MALKYRFAIPFMAIAVFLPAFAQAGGLSLYEVATSDVGLASAGWAARAQDPATLLKNPAGMSLLEGNQFQGGLQLLQGSIGFSPRAGTTVPGDDGGNPVGLIPAASAFYVHGVGKDIKLGLGLFSNFGLGLSYNSGWVGRYYALENTLIGVTVMPGASYRLNEQWSIGAAANIMIGYLNYNAAVNNNFLGLTNQPDGEVQMRDTTVGAGGNFGLLYEPRKGTRFGLTYYSPVKLNFGDVPAFTGLTNPALVQLQNLGLLNNDLSLGMTVPQQLIVSSYHELTDRWAMMLDFGWQQWSQFGKVDVSVNSPAVNQTLRTNINYQDTYHVALGNRYRLNDKWLINSGFAYDTSMVNDEDRTVTTPIGQIFRFALGAEWQANPKLNVALSYQLAYTGDMPVNQSRGPLAGTLVGSFPGTYLNFFQVSFIWGGSRAQTSSGHSQTNSCFPSPC
jgi:long-chain fatty acid transport protein